MAWPEVAFSHWTGMDACPYYFENPVSRSSTLEGNTLAWRAELRDAGLVANGTRRCSRGRWPRTRTGLNEAGYNKHGKPVKDSVSQELDGSAGVLAPNRPERPLTP